MVLSCPVAIVALYILELSSVFFQGPAIDMNSLPVEDREMLVYHNYPKGSTISTDIEADVRILHIQEDEKYNPYFGFNNQTETLYNKMAINIDQDVSHVGTFMMAVSKKQQNITDTLLCVTYCIGELSDPTLQGVCNESLPKLLVSKHFYQVNISEKTPVSSIVAQLGQASKTKLNVSYSLMGCAPGLFSIDHDGVLRTLGSFQEQEGVIYELKMLTSMIFSNKTQRNLANVRVVIEGVNDFRPMFEQPNGYTFTVMEGIQGITVGVVEAVDLDAGNSGKVTYALARNHERKRFKINSTSGEITTAVPLDRETTDSHWLSVVARDHGAPESFNSKVDVHIIVEDINDNPPIFVKDEYRLSISAESTPGLILTLNATDEDIGDNAKMMYTITEGNDDGIFWLDATSGKLYLVKEMNVTSDDSIVLVVEVRNIASENPELQDLVVVWISFVNVGFLAAQDNLTSLALRFGAGGLAFVVIVIALALFVWRRRRRRMAKRAKRTERDSESLATQPTSIVNIALNMLEGISKKPVERESDFEKESKRFFHPLKDEFLTDHTIECSEVLRRTKSLPASLPERRTIQRRLPILRATRDYPERLEADNDDALHPETTEDSNSPSSSSDLDEHLSFGCITEKGASSAFPKLEGIFRNLSDHDTEVGRAAPSSATHSLGEGQAHDTGSQYVSFDQLFFGSFKEKEPCPRLTAHETVTDSSFTEDEPLQLQEQTETFSLAPNFLEGKTSPFLSGTRKGTMPAPRKDTPEPEPMVAKGLLLSASKGKKGLPRQAPGETRPSKTVLRTFRADGPSKKASLPIASKKSADSPSAESGESQYFASRKEESLPSWERKETSLTASNFFEGQTSSLHSNTETGSMPPLRRDTTEQILSKSDQVAPQNVFLSTSKVNKAYPRRTLSEIPASVTRTSTDSPPQSRSQPIVSGEFLDRASADSRKHEDLLAKKEASLSPWEQTEVLSTASNLLEGQTRFLQHDLETGSMPPLRRDTADQLSSKPVQVAPKKSLLPTPQAKAFPRQSLSESKNLTSVTRTFTDRSYQTESLPDVFRKSEDISVGESKESEHVSTGKEESSSLREATETLSMESNLLEAQARFLQFDTERRSVASLRRDAAEQVPFQFEPEAHQKSLLPTSKETKPFPRQSLSKSQSSKSVKRTSADSPSQSRSQPIVSREFLDRSSADSEKHEDLLAGKEASLSSLEQTESLSTASNLIEGQARSFRFDTERRSIASLRRDTAEQVPFQFEQEANHKSLLPTSKEKIAFPRLSLSESENSASVTRTSMDSSSQTESLLILSRKSEGRSSADSEESEHVSAGKEETVSLLEPTETLSMASNLLEGQTSSLQLNTEGSIPSLRKEKTEQLPSISDQVEPQKVLFPTSIESKALPHWTISETGTSTTVERTFIESPSQTRSLPILMGESVGMWPSDSAESEYLSDGKRASLSLWEQKETLSSASNLLEGQTSFLQCDMETGSMPPVRRDTTDQVSSKHEQVGPQKWLLPTPKERKAFPRQSLRESTELTSVTWTFTDSSSQTESLPAAFGKSKEISVGFSEESKHVSAGKEESFSLLEPTETLSTASNLLEGQASSLQLDTERRSIASLVSDRVDRVPFRFEQETHYKSLLPTSKEKKAFPRLSLSESENSASVTRTSMDSSSQTESLSILSRKSEGRSSADSGESEPVSAGKEETVSLLEPTETLSMASNLLEGQTSSLQLNTEGPIPSLRKEKTEQLPSISDQVEPQKVLFPTSIESKALPHWTISETGTSTTVERTFIESPSQTRSLPILMGESVGMWPSDSAESEYLSDGKRASLSLWEQKETLSSASNLLEGQTSFLQCDMETGSMPPVRRDTTDQVSSKHEQVGPQKWLLPTPKERKAFPRQSLRESTELTSVTRTFTDSSSQTESLRVAFGKSKEISVGDSEESKHVSAGKEESFLLLEPTETLSTASNLLEGQTSSLQLDTERRSIASLVSDRVDRVPFRFEQETHYKSLLPTSKEKKAFPRQYLSESEISASVTRTSTDSPSQSRSQQIVSREILDGSSADSGKHEDLLAGKEPSLSSCEETETLPAASNLLEAQTCSLQFETETGLITPLGRETIEQVPSESQHLVPIKSLFPSSKESRAFPRRSLSETATLTSLLGTITTSPSETGSLPILLRKSEGSFSADSEKSEHVSAGKEETLSFLEPTETLSTASSLLEGQTSFLHLNAEGSIPTLRKDKTEQVPSVFNQVDLQKWLLPTPKEKKALPRQFLSESEDSTSITMTFTDSSSQTEWLPVVFGKSKEISVGDSGESKHVSAGKEESVSLWEPTETLSTASNLLEGQTSSLQLNTEGSIPTLRKDNTEQVPSVSNQVDLQKWLLPSPKETKALPRQSLSESKKLTSVTRTCTDSSSQTESLPVAFRKSKEISFRDSEESKHVSAGKEETFSLLQPTDTLPTASNLLEAQASSLQLDTERRSIASSGRDTAEQVPLQFEPEALQKSLLPTSKEKKAFPRQSLSKSQSLASLTRTSTDSPSQSRSQQIVSREFLDRSSADSEKHEDLLAGKEASLSSCEETETLPTTSNLLEGQARSLRFDTERTTIASFRRNPAEQVPFQFAQEGHQRSLLPTSKETKAFPRQSLSQNQSSTYLTGTSADSPSQSRSQPIVSKEFLDSSSADSGKHEDLSAGKETSLSFWEQRESLSRASNLLNGQTRFLQHDTETESMPPLQRDTAEQMSSKPELLGPQKSLLPPSKEKKAFPRQSLSESQTLTSATRTSKDGPSQSRLEPIVSREFMDRSSFDSGKHEDLLSRKEASLSSWEQTESLSTASNMFEGQPRSLRFETETALITPLGRETTEQVPSECEQFVPAGSLLLSSKDSGSYPHRAQSETGTLSSVTRTSKPSSSQSGPLPIVSRKSEGVSSGDSKECEHVSARKELPLLEPTETLSTASSLLEGEARSLQFDTETGLLAPLRRETTEQVPSKSEKLVPLKSLFPSSEDCRALPHHTLSETGTVSSIIRTSTTGQSLPIKSRKLEKSSSSNSEESSTGEESFSLWQQTETGSMANLTGGSAGDISDLEYVLKESSLPTSLQSEDSSSRESSGSPPSESEHMSAPVDPSVSPSAIESGSLLEEEPPPLWQLTETGSFCLAPADRSISPSALESGSLLEEEPPPLWQLTETGSFCLAPADRSLSPSALESGSLLEEEPLPLWQLTESGSFCLARVDSMETSASEGEHTSSTSGLRSPESTSTTSSDFDEDEASPFWRMTEKG